MADPVLTVTALTANIKRVMEQQFVAVRVTGEVSRFTRHGSGHLYFTIKDAHAAISAVVWRSAALRLRCPPHEGGQFLFVGHLSVYAPRGTYQLVVRSVAPAGEGALAAEFERRKQELAARGWFDSARKRPLPNLPSHIGIVTSTTAAALEDVRKVLASRPGWLRLTLAPALVQGVGASASIVQAMARVAAEKPDLILLVRGGGSMEDLWCFNDESVVEAVLRAPVPVITGVGHEIDTTLADLAADVRAATPSNAAELCCQDRVTLAARLLQPAQLRLHHAATRFTDGGHQRLLRSSGAIGELAQGVWRQRQRQWLDGADRLRMVDPRHRLRRQRQQLHQVEQNLAQCRQSWLRRFQQRVGQAALRLRGGRPVLTVRQQVWRGSQRELREMLLRQYHQRRQYWMAADQTLRALDPYRVLARGFVMVRGEDGRVLTSVQQLEPEARLQLRFGDGLAKVMVEEIV
ncbi:MAG: exodeoxyribonuclease VII large subunit [Mariprofundales bacterium]|nr:exodeoxyribonuclease VII large subunit [Mariprofundales bacterium]